MDALLLAAGLLPAAGMVGLGVLYGHYRALRRQLDATHAGVQVVARSALTEQQHSLAIALSEIDRAVQERLEAARAEIQSSADDAAARATRARRLFWGEPRTLTRQNVVDLMAAHTDAVVRQLRVDVDRAIQQKLAAAHVNGNGHAEVRAATVDLVVEDPDPVGWDPVAHVWALVPSAATPGFAAIIDTAAGDYVQESPGALPLVGATNLAADAGHRHGGISSYVNHSVNGLLDFWQRPVQAYTASGGTAGPDHLFITLAGTDTISCTQDTANADTANGAQFDLACVFTLGTGGGASGIISGLGGYKLTTDAFRFWRGRQITRTWRLRTNVGNAVRIAVTTDGTGGTTTYSAYHPGDGTQQTLSVTSPVIPADATHIDFKVLMGASATVYVGAHATAVGAVGLDPYVGGLSAADDLARCLRYYEVFGTDNNGALIVASAAAAGAAASQYTSIVYKAVKAVTPTVTKNGTWGISNAGQPSVNLIGKDLLSIGVSSLAAGGFYAQNTNAGSNVTVEANP